jgi:hypothetical protein
VLIDEGAHGLDVTVELHFEVVSSEARHRLAVPVEDRDVHRHERDATAEYGCLLSMEENCRPD